ncbi:Putative excisionase (DUF1233) [Raoultella ornithinolytica]|nr:Putative excisionase (DUF1233) [Raoultella ornithinolytica]
MSDVIQLVPNKWVTEKKLTEITGLRSGTIERARKNSWFVVGNICMFHLMVIQTLTASVCITWRRLING